MPFTLSHPAIVLPLYKASHYKLPLTALIIGSMSPDFEYFLRLRLYGEYGHTLLGIWWFCLPFSLVICYLLHEIIKKPFMDNLPAYWQYKYADLILTSWLDYCKSRPLKVVGAIVIGAYSHIFWDSFTHNGGYLLEFFGWQEKSISLPYFNFRSFKPSFFTMPLYKILQHSSTFLGAAILTTYLLCYQSTIYRQNYLQQSQIHKTKTVTKINFWLLIIIVFILLLSFRLYTNPQMLSIGHLVVNIITIAFLSTLIVSVLYIKKSKKTLTK